jgi:phosphonate transport system substrate-binding protein
MTHTLTRRRWLAAATLGSPAWFAAAQGSTAPLSLAIAPFLSPTALLTAFRPLREHLERTLARPVEMLTAKDFRSLYEAVRAHRHDVAMLPAHVARLAITDWRHEPLAATLDTLPVLVLVHRDSGARSAADLRGTTVGMLDALALTGTVGRLWLKEQGLAATTQAVTVPSINSALISLDRGELAAVVATDSQLRDLPASTPRSERVLTKIGDIAGPMYVARADLPAAERQAVRAALLAFTPDPSRPITAANARLHPIDPAALVRLDALAAIARQALAG